MVDNLPCNQPSSSRVPLLADAIPGSDSVSSVVAITIRMSHCTLGIVLLRCLLLNSTAYPTFVLIALSPLAAKASLLVTAHRQVTFFTRLVQHGARE